MISTNRWSTVLLTRRNSPWKRTRCGECCISKKVIRKRSASESKCPKIWPRGPWISATSIYGKTCPVMRILWLLYYTEYSRFMSWNNKKRSDYCSVIAFVISDQYVSNLLRRDMLSRYVQFLQSVFRDCEWPIALADIPIKVFDDDHYYVHFQTRSLLLWKILFGQKLSSSVLLFTDGRRYLRG